MTERGFVHDSTELRRLIAENPDLPIVVIVGEYAWSGEFGWEYCANVWCEVDDILDCETPFNCDYIYSDRDRFEEDMENYLYDLPEMRALADKEFEQAVKAEIAKYEPYWKKVIAIKADN